MTQAPIDKKYRFRDHPKLRYHGLPTWPPDWGGVDGGCDVTPRGEVGILHNVAKVEADSLYPERLFLAMEYNGKATSGGLWVEESEFCEKFLIG